MKVKTHLTAGGFFINHNETLVRERPKGIKVKTHLKAGALQLAASSLQQNLFTPPTNWERFGQIVNNHNETLVRDRAKGLKVKTHLKAGALQLASSSLTQNLLTPITSWERFAGMTPNHNETLVRDRAKGLKVKTHLKAGAVLMPQLPNQGIFTPITNWERFAGITVNHNETLVQDAAN